MTRGDIDRNQQFLLFPKCFLHFLITRQPFSSNRHLQTLSVLKSLKLVLWERVNLSPTMLSFNLDKSSFFTCWCRITKTVDWMVFYATFNSISVISRQQFTLFTSSWVSPVLGRGSEVSCPRTLPWKKPRRSSAARTQDPWIMSQTLYHWAMKGPPPKQLTRQIFLASDFHTRPR